MAVAEVGDAMSFAALLGRPSQDFCASMRCDVLAPSSFLPLAHASHREETPHRWPLVGGEPGAVLLGLRLVTIVAPRDPFAPALVTFGARFPNSAAHRSLREAYGVPAARPTTSILGDVARGEMDERACASWVARAIERAPGAAADGATIYVAYLPDEVHAPCVRLRRWGAAGDRWAVVPRALVASLGAAHAPPAQRPIERATVHAFG